MRVHSIFYVFVLVAGAALAFSGALSWAQECGDLDNSGAIVTTDALLVLRHAVGQSVALMCPLLGLSQTGQATAYGPGSDGDVQAGAALSYTDNGDGTITDNDTGLTWEKKDDSGGIHDKDNTYSWASGATLMDGTIMTVFLDTLNDVAGGGANCFAGHCDWRIPNKRELESIDDSGVSDPTIAPVFNQPATCTGCTDVRLPGCSCTASRFYLSSTTHAALTVDVWGLNFFDGQVAFTSKTNFRHARAVRGGL